MPERPVEERVAESLSGRYYRFRSIRSFPRAERKDYRAWLKQRDRDRKAAGRTR